MIISLEGRGYWLQENSTEGGDGGFDFDCDFDYDPDGDLGSALDGYFTCN